MKLVRHRNYICYMVLLGFFSSMFFIQLIHQHNIKYATSSEETARSFRSEHSDNDTRSAEFYPGTATEDNATTSPLDGTTPYADKIDTSNITEKPSGDHSEASGDLTVDKFHGFLTSNIDVQIEAKGKPKDSSQESIIKAKVKSVKHTAKNPPRTNNKKPSLKRHQQIFNKHIAKNVKNAKPKKKPVKGTIEPRPKPPFKTAYMKSIKDPKRYRKVVNKHNFKFLTERKNICADHPHLYILFVVHTAPKNIENRKMIRDTWGDKTLYDHYNIKTVFFTGVTNDSKVMNALKNESEVFGDIVIQNYVDSYRNLTYKAMSWLQWVDKNCPNISYVLKVDDDVFANIFQLIKMLKSFDATLKGKISNVIMCQKRTKAYPFRKKTKWRVTREEYPDDIYPPHCPGYAVILGRGLIPKLSIASYLIPYFWIDDVYFTGILTARVSVNIMDISSRYTKLTQKKKLVDGKSLFAYHSVKDDRFRKYWTDLYNKYTANNTKHL